MVKVLKLLMPVSAFVALTTSCSQESAAPLTGAEALTDFARENAHVFETTEPNGSCEDLGFPGEMTAGINVVGLGEARHDGHEFFSMKRSLIECLVAEHGFTHLVMEDSLPYGDCKRHLPNMAVS